MSTVQKVTNLPPKYIEDLFKDLFSNLYNVDPETGMVSGLLSKSPLEGTPIFETDEEGNQVLDEDGNPIPVYELDEEGNQVLDQYGDPVQRVEGGVPRPAGIRFTDPQIRALEMLVGKRDDEGNLILDEEGNPIDPGGIGAYEDMFGDAESYFDTAGDSLDPSSEDFQTKFYNPYVEKVIDATEADIQRAGDINAIGQRAGAVAQGAYGGSRQAVAEQEAQRNINELKTKAGADLRAKAFDNMVKYGQDAAKLFTDLGVKSGVLGEATQDAQLKDINALFNIGTLEQEQLQREYDVERAGDLEEAFEPYGRFGYFSDILTGAPSGGSSYSTVYTPEINPVGNTYSMGVNQNITNKLGNKI